MLTLQETFDQAWQNFDAGEWGGLQALLDDNVVVCAVNKPIVAEGKAAVIAFLRNSGGNFTPRGSCHPVDNGNSGTTQGIADWTDSDHPGTIDTIHYIFGFVNRGAGWRILTLSATSH